MFEILLQRPLRLCAPASGSEPPTQKSARLAHTFGPGMSIDDGRVQADFSRKYCKLNEDIVLARKEPPSGPITLCRRHVHCAVLYILLNSDDMVYNISSEDSCVTPQDLAQALWGAFPERGVLALVFDIPEL